jgi:hypothetical protein
MPNNEYENEPNQSRSEDIISSILDGTEYDEPARSRIEYLLIQLKEAIEGGGGGGGVTSYSPLTEKPKIDNHTLQAGNNSSSDLGLQTKLTFDSAPTENSTNPVTSGGVYTALGTKANSSDVYNKSAVDTALGAKADKSTTYTKTEVDTALSSKQNTISDLSTIRSGAALGATAVQPVSGKGLSTNDYTNDEKSKLAGIEAQANKTTVDSALNGTSTNPVQNKVVKSALDGKQTSLTTAQLAAVNSGITSADVEQIEKNKNNILLSYNLDGQHNLLPLQNGVYSASTSTITVQDGVATLKSVDTGTHLVQVGTFMLKAGTYVLFNRYTSTGNGDIRLIKGSTSITTGNPATFTLDEDANIAIQFYTYNAIAESTIQPMLVTEAQYNSGLRDFQPYALPNTAITPALKECVDNGVKNKVKINISSGTYASIVTTVSNGVITLSSGTASTSPTILTFSEITLPAGNYVLSGCAAGGSDTTYRLDVRSSGTTICGVYGNDFVEFTLSAQTTITVNIRLQGGYSIPSSGLVFKPMVCEKSLYDVSPAFEPYAMSNTELTTDVLLLARYEQIPNNTNLNTLTTLGKRYQCNSAAIAATLTNCPTTDGFMLYIKETASAQRFVQEIIPNKENEIYRRWYTSLGFSSWYKFTGTVVS